MMPGMARRRHEEVEKRTALLAAAANTFPWNRVERGAGETGVVTSGIAYQYAREVFGDVSYLKLGMVYPFPEKLAAAFAQEVKELYVVEEAEPFLEAQIKQMGQKAKGKELLPVTGELSPALLRERIFGEKPQTDQQPGEEIPVRPPVMCPGCPHRGVFYVLKKLRLTVTGDIGCYTLGALPPNEALDACVCMGASIGMLHGMEKARGREFIKKAVAVIGDSTFIHSGITGLIDIVYNKGISTVIILDNATTGMTGHQDHPGTGRTVRGMPAEKLDPAVLAKAVGVRRVKVVDPFAVAELQKTVREETQAGEPSVIIARRPCALLERAEKHVVVRVNEEKCRQCRQCLALGCPAVVEKEGRIQINEALCAGCLLCTKLCPFGAVERVER